MKKVIATIAVVAFVVALLPSCKHQGSCDAYQGSRKSSRSHKKRHAEVVRVTPERFKA